MNKVGLTMAIDFPDTPAVNGTTFVASNGVTYGGTAPSGWPSAACRRSMSATRRQPRPARTSCGGTRRWVRCSSGTTTATRRSGFRQSPTSASRRRRRLRCGDRSAASCRWRSQPTVDFTNIPADINDLWATFDVTPTVNGAGFVAQFFDGAGAIINAGLQFCQHHQLPLAECDIRPGCGGLKCHSLHFEEFILTWHSSLERFSAATGLRGRLTVPNIRDVARYKGGRLADKLFDQ